ncbi:SWIM zinc finger family protein [Baaleninema sp.]|uniref:SWIM zinc finger family protein n=1 Tax=Baaleninema sp. TaxID=3101197 RepID=UPI003D008AAC
MSLSWTIERVVSLATDDKSQKAARGLAQPRHWDSCGRSDRAVWGECLGSGKTPYRTQVDLTEPAFRCSCPSRKFPCKHALGLLFLFTEHLEAIPETTPPDWVQQWLQGRDERAAKSTNPTQERQKSPQKSRKTIDRRAANVKGGMEELSLWLRDVMRQGLASLQGKSDVNWESIAARMVDAQAPGIAKQLRDMARIPYTGAGWHERLLERLGLLWLLLEGYQRLESLPPGMQAEIRAQIGWTQRQSEVLEGSGEIDRWWVAGQSLENEHTGATTLKAQRTWLVGERSHRWAVVLHYVHHSQALENSWVPGTGWKGEVVFYDGAYPLRGLVKSRDEAVESLTQLPGFADIEAGLTAYAEALGRNPWLDRFPLSLSAVVPLDGGTRVVDELGNTFPISPKFQQNWQLMAVSGGRAVSIFGEWDGLAWLPLGVVADGRFVGF